MGQQSDKRSCNWDNLATEKILKKNKEHNIKKKKDKKKRYKNVSLFIEYL